MAFENRDYTGGAVQTTITASINATDLSISIASATGWPSGGANGPFFICIDRGLAGEEKIEVQSRTGTTLTVASTGKRGIDGTVASSHSSGAAIMHVFTAQDADEANQHITNTGLDHHTQYLNTSRHDLTARHTIGSVIPAGTPGTITPDASASAGAANSVARSDHAHATAAATAVTSGLANAEGVSTSFARADHTHDQAALSVDTAELVDNSVTAAKIAPDAVGASELANGAVSVTGDVADGIITLAKMASEAPIDWSASITFDNVVLGTGGHKWASYYKLGRFVILFCGFYLGTSGDVTAKMGFNLPFTAADLVGTSPPAIRGGIAVGRVIQFPGGTAFSGLGTILDSDGKATDFITAGGLDAWGSTGGSPLGSAGNGSSFEGTVVYVATS